MVYLLHAIMPILQSIIITIGIIIGSFIIEKTTGLKLFIDHYTWVKSPANAKILSDGDSGYFIILNIIVFIYNIYKNNIAFHWITFFLWLFFLLILTRILYKIHYKYQKIDPNKADDDYS